MKSIRQTVSIQTPVTRMAIAIVAVCFSFAMMNNAYADTATGSASVEIRQALTMSETQALDFGTVSTNTADTVIISPAGIISSQNGSNILNGTGSAGRFTAVGSTNAAVTISFTGGVLNGIGSDMSINNLVHDSGDTPSFDTDGTLSFGVGGSLNINDNQLPGIYAGTYVVSVNYQ